MDFAFAEHNWSVTSYVENCRQVVLNGVHEGIRTAPRRAAPVANRGYVTALTIAAIAVAVELAAMYFWLIFGPFPEGGR